jgi:hypothetical protein
MVPRDLLDYFDFDGESIVDRGRFYKWTIEIELLGARIFNIYTDQTGKRVMKRM